MDCAISGNFLRLDEDGRIPADATTPVLYTEDWAYAPIGPERQRQLFDLRTDPYAETDVAAAHPDTVANLHARFTDWLKDLQSPPETLDLLGDDALA
jgi:hypothetical protein